MGAAASARGPARRRRRDQAVRLVPRDALARPVGRGWLLRRGRQHQRPGLFARDEATRRGPPLGRGGDLDLGRAPGRPPVRDGLPCGLFGRVRRRRRPRRDHAGERDTMRPRRQDAPPTSCASTTARRSGSSDVEDAPAPAAPTPTPTPTPKPSEPSGLIGAGDSTADKRGDVIVTAPTGEGETLTLETRLYPSGQVPAGGGPVRIALANRADRRARPGGGRRVRRRPRGPRRPRDGPPRAGSAWTSPWLPPAVPCRRRRRGGRAAPTRSAGTAPRRCASRPATSTRTARRTC